MKEESEERRKDLRLAQNFSMGLRSGEYGGKKIIFLLEEEIKVERRDLL